MKFFTLLILVGALSYSRVNAQASSDCTAPALLASTYYNDVRDMALARIYAIRSADTVRISIPDIYCDTILQGLAAIYHTGTTLQADSIFDAYCIHACPYGNLKFKFDLHVDNSHASEWSWGPGVTPADTTLSNLMMSHGFTITSTGADPVLTGAELINISTDSAVNPKAFIDSLNNFPGLLLAEATPVPGDGNHITYQKSNFQNYSFTLGFGDCPSGCTSKKIWTYTVDSACNVIAESVNESGPDLYPAAPNCHLFKAGIPTVNEQLTFKTYPNPADDDLHISITDGNAMYTYTLKDIYGKILRNGIMNTATIVDIKPLPAGIYLLQINGNNGQMYNEKVVKH
jgi:hypothetical protein